MSDLEKYMMEIRDQMDLDEPDPGHMKRFSRKLKNSQQPLRKLNFRHGLQIAASIAIILASGVVIIKSSKGGDKVAASPVSEEFRQTKNYYAQQVNARYEEIAALPFDSQQEKEMLLDELTELNVHYQELMEELKANPGDERVVNALIQHYQIKLRVMDQIIEQLMELKNKNQSQNEKSTV